MGVEMLQIMAGKDGIDTLCLNRTHIGHGAGDVWFNSWIDIKPDLRPYGLIEAIGRLIFALLAAPNVEKLLHR